MSPWASGDTLDAATLNARQASAASVGGFSTNTLKTESGGTVVVQSALSLNETLQVLGTGALGGLAVGGGFYNHVLVSAGLGVHPLVTEHQVAFYAPIRANSYASTGDGFVAGFETALGTQAGAGTVPVATNFSTGAVAVASGTTVTRTYGINLYDETAGQNNVAISTYADSAFTGDWFIHYIGTRPSWLSGALTVRGAVEVRNILTVTGASAFSGLLNADGGVAATQVVIAGAGDLTLPGTGYGIQVTEVAGRVVAFTGFTAAFVGQVTTKDGTAIAPGTGFASEASLGFYRSAASVMALSYGWLSAPRFISSSTTNQSASSAKIANQGEIVFSILSLTTNGAAMYYRSGNSVFGWASNLVVG